MPLLLLGVDEAGHRLWVAQATGRPRHHLGHGTDVDELMLLLRGTAHGVGLLMFLRGYGMNVGTNFPISN
jgi:hypothetical protein